MKRPAGNVPPSPSLTWAYFLDVDGTLINLAETPQSVVIDTSLLDLVGNLYAASGGAVALVSGRSISDLQGLIGMPQLPLAGLHGLERRDSSGRLWIHAAPPLAKSEIRTALAPALSRHAGLILEDKGLTLAVHYRQAPQLAGYVHKIMRRFIVGKEHELELQCGKRVVEIKPVGIDKGTAVAEYAAELPFKGRQAVFIGDDLNDEHGFAEVNRLGGISVKVGQGPSCAQFRLPNVAAVRLWLGGALKGTT